MNDTPPPEPDQLADTDVAIIGMAGHFPGAPDADVLWERINRGDDCLDDLDPADLIRDGVPAATVGSPEYVLRNGCIDGVDQFDPEFFGISKRDAAVMDPQHRHFIECAWEALESSAHTPEGFPGSIGVFGGSGMNTYLLHNLLTNPTLVEELGWFLLRHTGNDKDFLTTTLSYRLGLRGPSVNVQTACSTSLVAVHLAAQSLLSFECDLALAGGVTIEFPHGRGYQYREGEILSPSGRCRAFDAASEGTVLTGGAAVVALRRLTDAYRDGDPILAVIKGSAVNNDGNRKVGFFAPSIDGHADVVKEALAVSGVDPRTIGLLEAHGTGTAVGDPIEVAALTEAFRTYTDDVGFCRLGSTKPNIGHLDTAAGTASLVKVVQALRHRTLPPIANHTGPSPLLELDRSPFALSGSAAPWESDGPRRAGISSLGVGGTNAHVIVEEAPAYAPTPPATPGQVFVLSGGSRAAVDDATERLAAFLEREPETNIADVAHTLLTGRRAMNHRRVVAVTDSVTAPTQLRSTDRRRRPTAVAPDEPPRVAFVFPGGGAQYPGMGAGLDGRFEVFHRVRQEGVEAMRRLGGVDVGPLLDPGVDPDMLRRATASLPAVFITSTAMARQWMAWGVEPDVMIGHSLGEYVAAHLAGVLSFDDALSLVITRSGLMERVSGVGASMLVVPLPEREVVRRLPAALSLATVNADDECVVAGPAGSVGEFAEALAVDGIEVTHIPLAAAAHSSMLDSVLDEFESAVRAVTLLSPQRRYISNLTGDWIDDAQATSPRYWVDHLRHTVRFADGLRTALTEQPTVVVEVGPGQTLASYARRSGLAVGAISTLRHPDDDITDTLHTLTALGQLWVHGIDVDLAPVTGPDRRRLRLPTYPFQRERCWIEPGRGSVMVDAPVEASTAAVPALVRIGDVEQMGWLPTWSQAPARPSVAGITHWTVVGGAEAEPIATELRRRGRSVSHVARFVDRERADGGEPAEHGVVLVGGGGSFEAASQRWLGDAPAAARWLGTEVGRGRLVAVTQGALGADQAASTPSDALALGVVLVAPREYADVVTAIIDLDPDRDAASDLASTVDEIEAASGVIALRGATRLAPATSPAGELADVDEVGFRHHGTYLITGGLGGVGEVLATHLANTYSANLAIVSTDSVPEGLDREVFLRRHAYDHPTCRRIRRVMSLEQLGVKVLVVQADLGDAVQLRAALDAAERVLGPLDGAIHAAGRLRDRLIDMASPDDLRFVADPKAGAALVLADELERRRAELLVLVSSTSTMLAPAGQSSYVAANSVLDSLAGRRGSLRVVTLGFGVWSSIGMAADAARRVHLGLPDGAPFDHPVLGEVGIDHHGRTVVSGRVDVGHHWMVDEHRSPSGDAVLPGTGHLELFVAAGRAVGLTAVRLEEVSLLEPLVVADDTPVTVRVVVDADLDGRRAIRLDSDGGTGLGWTTHSEAVLVPDDAPPTRLDLDAIATRCGLDGIDLMGPARAHLQLGEHWSIEASARLGDGESFGIVGDGAAAGIDGDWLVHPALVDIATGFGILLTPPEAAHQLHVPVGYDSVRWSAPVSAGCAVHATRRPDSTDDLLRVDLAISDATGLVVVRVDGLQLRPIADAATLGTAMSGVVPTSLPTGSGLLDLVEPLGLRPAEGTMWLDRLVASAANRLIVTSIDLDALRSLGNGVEITGAATPETTSRSGGATLEQRLTSMWQELLGADSIGPDDDFFDLGGHSLMAIRLMTRIKREFGVRFDLSAMFDTSTVSLLAARIRGERPDIDTELAAPDGAGTDRAVPAQVTTDQHVERKQLVTISSRGAGRPLYVVHGAGGNVLFLSTLARAMGGDRPVHAFQAVGVNDGELPDVSIEAMASRYVAELRAHSSGPHLLAGYSGGGIVALEMARQLLELGDSVAHVILFDSVPPRTPWPSRRERWSRLAMRAVRSGPADVAPYVKRNTKQALRRFVPERAERAQEHQTQEQVLGYVTDDTGFVNLYHYFSATAERYQLARYDVDVTVLKADHVWPVHRDDYYWRDHVTGSLSWHSVPGDHHSMFYPEHAPALAHVVNEVLRRVEHPSDPAG